VANGLPNQDSPCTKIRYFNSAGRPEPPYILDAESFEIAAPSGVRMSNVFASGELSGNKDGIFYKLNPPVYSVLTHVHFVRAISGSEAEKFRVFTHANNGTKEFVGEFPKVADTLFLTWPPMYPGVAVLEIHPNRATAAEAGQHTVLQSLGN
jgi:hypothetical protein